MDIGVSNRVIARNSFGRFIRECEAAGQKTVMEAVELGASLSRSLAPVGPKKDKRTVKLKDSISVKMLSSTSGVWVSSARHTLPIEKGATPHTISGDVTFFWEKHDRMWNPGQNTINHPGNAAQPFLQPAYDIVSKQVIKIADKNYPG